jgi:hypothetical protein
MTVDIRIPGKLYELARADLERPHAFAAERVGFFTAKFGRVDASHLIVMFTAYDAVPDSDYLDDPFAGARIGSGAIRASLQRVLDRDAGQFHVHLHSHRGRPGPSPMDARETPKLIDSMVSVNPACAHGALILSFDRAWASVRVLGELKPVVAAKITVAGFPMRFLSQ